MTKPDNDQNKTRRPKTKTTQRPRPPPESTARPAVDTLPARTPGQRPSFAGFDRERAAYRRHKSSLLAAAGGKYVVIVGDEVIGPLESHEEAERAGYTRFGLGPLYVKRVVVEEPVVEELVHTASTCSWGETC